MSELPSALFSIADGSEFRFTRFYIVCEAVPLGAPESPLIVCGFAGHTLWKVQTWKDTEFDVQRGMEEIFGFSSPERAHYGRYKNDGRLQENSGKADRRAWL